MDAAMRFSNQTVAGLFNGHYVGRCQYANIWDKGFTRVPRAIARGGYINHIDEYHFLMPILDSLGIFNKPFAKNGLNIDIDIRVTQSLTGAYIDAFAATRAFIHIN